MRSFSNPPDLKRLAPKNEFLHLHSKFLAPMKELVQFLLSKNLLLLQPYFGYGVFHPKSLTWMNADECNN